MEPFQNSDDLWEQVAKKFNKTLKSLDEDVDLLHQWLKTQPHLPDLLDSNCLRNFLILNKFSVEVSKQKIDNYFTMRNKFVEVYGDCHPELEYTEDLYKVVFLVPAPKFTEEMYRIGYFKFKGANLMDLYDPLSLVKLLGIIQELRLRKDIMYGDILVLDLKDICVSVLTKLSPSLAYTAVATYEKVYSMHLKAVYVINPPPFSSAILSFFKKFMKPKLFDRIHILEDADAIKDLIPLDLLPEDLGGKGPSMSATEEELHKLFKENSDLFTSLDEMTVNEKLRPGRLNADVFGVYGNFKKLDVD